jgi:hypothetical protein
MHDRGIHVLPSRLMQAVCIGGRVCYTSQVTLRKELRILASGRRTAVLARRLVTQ